MESCTILRRAQEALNKAAAHERPPEDITTYDAFALLVVHMKTTNRDTPSQAGLAALPILNACAENGHRWGAGDACSDKQWGRS